MSITTTPTIKILLIDDHEVLRFGLRMIIESHPQMQVIAEASNHAEALTAVAVTPDVIVLDIDLGDDNGLDLLPELRVRAPDARVLLLTGMRNPELHRRAVRLGATGVVLKAQALDTIVKAIERVYAGEVWLGRAMMAQVLHELVQPDATPVYDPEAAKIALLTAREREVIAVMCSRLKSGQAIEQLNITESTLRHHLTSIFGKLQVSDRVELVVYAYQHGLVDLPRSTSS